MMFAVSTYKNFGFAILMAIGLSSPLARATQEQSSDAGQEIADAIEEGFFERNGDLATINSSLTDADLKKVPVSFSDSVSIRPSIINGQAVDIVKVGNLPEFSVRAELSSGDYSPEEKQKLSVVRRDILKKTINGLLHGAGKAPILISDQGSVQTVIKDEVLGENMPIDAFADLKLATEARTPEQLVARRNLRQRAAAFFGFLNEAVLKSTYRAGKDFVKETRQSRGTEFGLSIVARGELQIGVGKTNIMRTIARGLDLGYDFHTHELVIRTVRRHEQMDSGTAMALGPKMELRLYRASLEAQERISNGAKIHGKSWYPPAPPLVTLASESYPGYHSIGTAVALNVFDIAVPTYLFNTVNEFDADYRVRRISLSALHYARASLRAMKTWIRPQSPQTGVAASILNLTHSGAAALNSCSAVFASN